MSSFGRKLIIQQSNPLPLLITDGDNLCGSSLGKNLQALQTCMCLAGFEWRKYIYKFCRFRRKKKTLHFSPMLLTQDGRIFTVQGNLQLVSLVLSRSRKKVRLTGEQLKKAEVAVYWLLCRLLFKLDLSILIFTCLCFFVKYLGEALVRWITAIDLIQ